MIRSRIVSSLDRLIAGVVSLGGLLALPVVLLLFLQWPLRDLVRAYSREANDLGQWLFALYVAKFASYDASYGSLGAVVVLLLWLYIAVFIVLLGAELNAEIESRMEAENKVADAPQSALNPPPKDTPKDLGSSPRPARSSNRRSS